MTSDLLGEIVVIKRNGGDGARFPLTTKQCTFGRDAECDIRIQIPQVEEEHAKIFFDNGKIWLQNLSSNLPTLLNSKAVDLQQVNHNDIFTITQRSFRFEFPDKTNTLSSTPRRRSSTKTPLKALQGSPRTPSAGESLKTSIKSLRGNSAAVPEEDESPFQEKSSIPTPTNQKENTPENELLVETPSILKKQGSSKRSEKKRISFGPNLSPELFDKTLPPSTPLRKGKSPARRLSEPLKGAVPGASKKKRCSLGTSLGKMPIMEEEEEANVVDLCDTPPQNLPTPLVPATTSNEVDNSSAVPQAAHEECKAASSEETIPKQTVKQCLVGRHRRLATPIRRQIRSGIDLRATRRRMNTPLRKSIEARPKLQSRIKKIATPLRKDIARKPTLRKTKQKLATPLRESIQKGVPLRSTKKKLHTPLREEIQKGPKLRQTKQRLSTPLQDEIKSKPSLRETKKTMRRSLQDEIAQGKQLQSKFADLKTLPEGLLEEIKNGQELRSVVKSAPTPLKKEIKDGVKLRETKRKMRKTLQAEIIQGKDLHKTMPSAPTPLRKAVIAGKKLRKTKQPAPTPLRKAIKQGVTLRKTKTRLNEDLQAEIKQGKDLKRTKLCAPTPIRNEIKAGVPLRKTKKVLDSDLQKEIKIGKELRTTKKSAPTPFKKEIKKGVKLRSTKKRLEESLQNEIKTGVTLVPAVKKASRIPVKTETNPGAKQPSRRKSTEAMREMTGGAEKVAHTQLPRDVPMVESEAGSSRSAPDSSFDRRINERPILRAKRHMAKNTAPVVLINQDSPKMASPKVGKPARKKVCRRSTPKKIIELRGNLQSAGQNDRDNIGLPDQDKHDVVSPVIAYTTAQVQVALNQSPKDIIHGMYLSETSTEDHSAFTYIPGFAEPLDAPKKVHMKSEHDSPAAETLIDLRKLMKTPKAGCGIVEVDLGLKRLLRTPKARTADASEVENNLGLKRLLKTPKLPKQQCVEENLGLNRLMKTPHESNAESPESSAASPESHCAIGLQRLLKSPKTTEEVDGDLGLKRLMKTPKQKERQAVQVEKNLGLKRLMQTPKEQTSEAAEIKGDLGLHRLMQSPKASIPSVSSPHLDVLFYDMRERKTKGIEVKEQFGLTRLMAPSSEKRSMAQSKYSLDVGSLPALFDLPKQEHQPVEDMQLQDMFVENDTCHTDNEATEPEQLKQRSINEGASPAEGEPLIKVTRRGRRNLCKEAPRMRSTRVTRGNKNSIPVIDNNDNDVVEVRRECYSEADASAPRETPEDARTSKRVTQRETKRTRMTRNVSSEKNKEQEESVEIAAKVPDGIEQKRSTRRKISSQPQETEAQPAAKRRKTRAGIRIQEDASKAEVAADSAEINADVVVHNPEIESVTSGNDAVSRGEVPRRRTRRCREAAANSTQTRATRSKKIEDAPVLPVALPTEISIEEDKVTEEMSDKVIAPSRFRPKRKCAGQFPHGISEGKTTSLVREDASTDSSQDGTERAGAVSGQKGRGRGRKVVTDATDNENAGLVKGMVKTPTTMKFAKTILQPISEDTEPHVDPVIEKDLPIKASSRRSRRKLTSEEEKDEPVAKGRSCDQGGTSITSSKANDCTVSIEPTPTVSCRQTRIGQKPLDAGEAQHSKRKRPTRSVSKQESTESENSIEENGSAQKRTRQATSKTKLAERSTRKSARLRNC